MWLYSIIFSARKVFMKELRCVRIIQGEFMKIMMAKSEKGDQIGQNDIKISS